MDAEALALRHLFAAIGQASMGMRSAHCAPILPSSGARGFSTQARLAHLIQPGMTASFCVGKQGLRLRGRSSGWASGRRQWSGCPSVNREREGAIDSEASDRVLGMRARSCSDRANRQGGPEPSPTGQCAGQAAARLASGQLRAIERVCAEVLPPWEADEPLRVVKTIGEIR